MKSVVPFRHAMTAQQFQDEVRRRIGQGFDHMMRVTVHAEEQMAARGVSRVMALRVLRRGTVFGPGMKWDGKSGNWTAPIVGIAAGVEVDVRCALHGADPAVVVITVVNKGEPK